MAIFDSARAEAVYAQYRRTGDLALENEMLEQSEALIGAIAASVGRNEYDDMFQEGAVKLVDIMRRGVYDPDRGSMYNFLSRVLTNHMLSAQRSNHGYDELSEDYAIAPLADVCAGSFNTDPIIQYGLERFVGLAPDAFLIGDMVAYAVQAILESCCEGYRGAVRTMMTMYALDRPIVSTVYFSMLAVARMESMGYAWGENVEYALELAGSDGSHTSLVPEVVLLLGPGLGCILALVFRGWFIKV
jgi:DNA-directed RNA polymerase specialized sigma24 family protein